MKDRQPPFSTQERIALAVAVVAIDTVLLVVPLTALLLAWVILSPPPWARRFLDRL